MDYIDEQGGEILVVRDPFRASVAVHIRGVTLEDYRVVKLTRLEARRLAALLLYQAERLADLRLSPAADPEDDELNCA